jgi:hypothetical protein
MTVVLFLILRLIFVLLGVSLIYVSTLLYENEYGAIQNRLEDMWVKFSDRGKTAVTAHVKTIQSLSRMTEAAFVRLFGKRLFSARAFAVSSMLSIASRGLFVLCTPGYHSSQTWATYGIPAAICLTLVAVSAKSRRQDSGGIWWLWVLLITPCCWALLMMGSSMYVEAQWEDPGADAAVALLSLSFIYLPVQLVAFFCDLLFVAFTRKVLHWCANFEKLSLILLVLSVNLIIGLLLVIVPLNAQDWIENLKYRGTDPYRYYNFVHIQSQAADIAGYAHAVATLNILDAFVAFALVGAGLLMLGNRILWPLLGRPLYAMQAMGTPSRKKLMFALGIILLSYGGLTIPKSIQEALATFS